MKSIYSNNNRIISIKSKRVRNILRGVINETENSKVEKALFKIQKIGSSSDYKKSIEIIRTSTLFYNNEINREFNKVCPKIPTESVSFSQSEIIDRINANQIKLQSIVLLYSKLVKSIQCMDLKETIKTSHLIIAKNGVSCFFLRALFYARRHFIGVDQELSDSIGEIFGRIKLDNVAYIENAIKELNNSKTDYFNICKKIKDSENGASSNIANSFVYHVVNTEEIFLTTLNAYYSFSLVDSFLYYVSIDRLCLPFTIDVKRFDESLLSAFTELSTIKVNPKRYSSNNDSKLSIEYFRDCFLLIELNDFFEYKTIHGSLYNKSESKEERRIPVEKEWINNYFAGIDSLDHLRTNTENDYQFNLKKFNSEKCLYIENSNALLFLIEKNDAELLGQEEKFVKLMSHTMDIGFTCPKHYFHKMRQNAKIDKLQLVLSCLILIKDQSHIAEHDLRKIIQNIIKGRGYSSVINLIEDLWVSSPSVTEHLIQICDETFLSKLFFVTKVPNEAIEERARILEWYGKKIDDSAYIERAKNLRIDIQISKEKGTIDDSRIYVDPVKYTQWINDNILDELTLVLELVIDKVDNANITVDWNKVKVGITHNEQMAAILLKCYEEFCTNNLFGIASYLGRRIRHGTFKGTGLKEVLDFRSNDKYSIIFQNREFSERYNEWLDEYLEIFDKLKDSYLHIYSKKKPEGMIFSGFNTKKKIVIANHMIKDVIDSYKRNKSSLEIPYVITDYCWRFIEEDLSKIRKFLMEIKSMYGVFNNSSSISIGLRVRDVQHFCQDLNSVTAEKFRTISSWFNKPSIASPSADLTLLFRAVLSEVKDFFKNYEPDLSYDDDPFEISGGNYFVIYDALYILLYNAAKYGKRNGGLKFRIDHLRDQKIIRISVASEVKNKSELLNSEKLINIALDADFEDAHIVEGRSGIKKLKRMEKDQYISGVEYQFQTNEVTSSFNLSVDY